MAAPPAAATASGEDGRELLLPGLLSCSAWYHTPPEAALNVRVTTLDASRNARGGSMADEEEGARPGGRSRRGGAAAVLGRGLERLRPVDAVRRASSRSARGGRASRARSPTTSSSPASTPGLHSDNAEEIVFVAEGEGEVFSIGGTRRARGRQVRGLPGGHRPRRLRAGLGAPCGFSRSSRRPRSSAPSSRRSTRSAATC